MSSPISEFKTELLIATTNRGKVFELRKLLADAGVTLHDLTAHASIAPVEETGQTFMANACLKAGYYAKAIGMWTLADDSGLAVDALNGKPGVHSARWAAMNGQGEGDEANNALLLKQLETVPDEKRTARFVCTLALSDPTGRIVLTTTDWVSGVIVRQARGGGGFGYDPLFLVPSLGATTAELAPEKKNAISHRGKASRRMVQLISELLF